MVGLSKHAMNQIALIVYQSCISHLQAFGWAGCTKLTPPPILN